MFRIVVTGAASGLGLRLALAFAERYPESEIWAMDVQKIPPELQTLDSRLVYEQVDITDEKSVAQVADKMSINELPVHLLVHSAGVRGLLPSADIRSSAEVAHAESFEVMDSQTMMRTFEINAAGFFLFARAMLPGLQLAAEGINGSSDAKREVESPPRVIVLGSRMGSIGSNISTGGGYAYRASKAALNAIVKSLSIDHKQVVWTIVHPGRVETGLVPVKEDGAMNTVDSVRDIIFLIEKLSMKDSGTFVDRFGEVIPW